MEILIEGIGSVFLEVSRKARNISISVRYPNKVRVAVPLGVSFEEAEKVVFSKKSWIKKNIDKFSNQISLDKELQSIDLSLAKKRLVQRLQYLADLHGFSYNKVTIRKQRTRWGSCSSNNDISLNIKLACLPQFLADYVMLHELVHTEVKDHSAYFWKFLDRYVDSSKKVDKALKRYSCA